MRLLITAFLLAGVCGCWGKSKEKPKEETKDKKSAIQTVVEGATGKTAIDAGRSMKKQLSGIQKQHNKELDDALDE